LLLGKLSSIVSKRLLTFSDEAGSLKLLYKLPYGLKREVDVLNDRSACATKLKLPALFPQCPW
jgi:hypothetical protein